MTKQELATEYLKAILIPLCRFPDEIQIVHTVDVRGLLLDLYTNDRDLSAIIGKAGINAFSLRNIMRLWGQKNEAVVKLLIKGKGMNYYEEKPDHAKT